MTDKRLFFAFDLTTVWPEELPQGRILEEKERHLTFIFLGSQDFEKIATLLPHLPQPNFKVGFTGRFDQPLFLSKVVAWKFQPDRKLEQLISYRNTLMEWLHSQGITFQERKDFLPHVTIARSPFVQEEWEKQFQPLPCYMTELHLYESIGNLRYQSLWQNNLSPPLVEISHMADLAFEIRGEDLLDMFHHAETALALHFPPLLQFFSNRTEFASLDEIIFELNRVISRADQEMGSPFKAVSYHGTIVKNPNYYSWEMIVDV